jgi:hypothetical protein
MKGVLRPAQKEKPFPIILTQPINILSPGLFTFIILKRGNFSISWGTLDGKVILATYCKV